MAKLLRVEEKALKLIREMGYVSVEELSRRLGLPPRAAALVVDSLIRRGLLEPQDCDCSRCPLAGACPYASAHRVVKAYRLRLGGGA